jgi:hypothetical protein
MLLSDSRKFADRRAHPWPVLTRLLTPWLLYWSLHSRRREVDVTVVEQLGVDALFGTVPRNNTPWEEDPRHAFDRIMHPLPSTVPPA